MFNDIRYMLPQIVFQDENSLQTVEEIPKQPTSKEGTCPVCLEIGDVELPCCKAKVHQICAEEWLWRSASVTCVCCRQPLPTTFVQRALANRLERVPEMRAGFIGALEEQRNYRLRALASGDATRIDTAYQEFEEMLNLCVVALGLHFLNYLPYLALEGDQVTMTLDF